MFVVNIGIIGIISFRSSLGFRVIVIMVRGVGVGARGWGCFCLGTI